MSFLWPMEPNPDPGFGTRLGRICHWCFIILGAAFAWLVANAEIENWGWANTIIVAVAAMIGRGLRYLFGGE